MLNLWVSILLAERLGLFGLLGRFLTVLSKHRLPPSESITSAAELGSRPSAEP